MPSACQQKLDLALRLAGEAGISRASTFPPLLRGLSALGLPVRPLHYMSTAGLATFLFIGMSLLLVVFHWLAAGIDVNAWAVNKLRDLGQAGAIVAAAAIAMLAATLIRVKAIRADLPDWRAL